jgi:hypothetical protein
VTIIVVLAILNFLVIGGFVALVIYTMPPGGRPTVSTGGPPEESPLAPIPTVAGAEPSPTQGTGPGIVPTFTPTSTPAPSQTPGAPEPEVVASTSPPVTATSSPAGTPTYTPSPTTTPTATAKPTDTATRTVVPSDTATATGTATSTATHTATRTSTPSSTPTLVLAATPSHRATWTPTSTSSPTWTHTSTSTPSPTWTETSTLTPSPTRTSTSTPSPTSTHTSTATLTPTHTSTSTSTPTSTHTWTATPTTTGTAEIASVTSTATPETVEGLSIPPPVPPVHVSAESVGGDQINLAWEAPSGSPGAIYRVYWDMGSGYNMYTFRTSVRDARFSDRGLNPSTSYRYQITTFDGLAESSPVGATVRTDSWLWLALARLGSTPSAATETSGTPVALPTPSIAPETPQPSEVILGLMGTNDYVDDLGTLHIVGEVHNDMAHNVDQIRVHLTFYDDAGGVLEAITGSALLDLMGPGQRAPFVIVWENPGDWKRYSLRATARATTERPSEGITVLHSYARMDEVGLYHVVGTIRNDGLTTEDYMRAVVSLYDSFGKISNAGFAFTEPSRIPPGTIASFDCPFDYYPYQAEHVVQIVQ